jgi:UDPglucose 6-dehydrogenase
VGYDPIAVENTRVLLPTVTYPPSALDALRDADACVLVTEWQDFLDLDWTYVKQIMARPIVIDGRNALDGRMLTAAGFTYEGVGTRLRHL